MRPLSGSGGGAAEADEGAGVRGAGDLQPAAPGPGQHQEIVSQLVETVDLVEGGIERLAHLGVVGGAGPGQLELTPDDGDRGTQLVAGLVEEGPLPGDGGADALEHGVEP